MSKQKINEIHKNKQPKKKKKHKWFTLVELIVVITILAILWTIAFISFQSYNRSARDWVRLSDLNNIEKSLWLFIIEKWRYPEPDLWVNVTYSWWLAWTQWTVWDKMMTNLVNINKKPVDPLTGNEYTYSVTSLKNEYQVWAIQEIWLLWSLPITKTYAATLPTKKAFAIVKWTYNEVLLKVNTGSTDYILAVPSIINSDINDLDLLSIITKKLLVHNNFQNLPYSYNWLWYTMTGWFNYVPAWNKLEVYKWSLVTLNWDTGLKKQLLDDLKQSYNWTIIWWDAVYTDVIKLDSSDLRNVEIFANNLLDNGIILKDTTVLKLNYSFAKALSWAIDFIKADTSWNVYLWWNFYWTISIWANSLTSSWWSQDSFFAKYDSSWNLAWAKKIWWNSYDYLSQLVVDNWWNVYLWWGFWLTMNVWSTILTSSWWTDWFVTKFDSSWNNIWAKKIWWVSSEEYLNWLAVDTSWNVYVWGQFYSTSVNIWWTNLVRVWTSDWFFVKYDSSWNISWSKKIWWTSSDSITSVSVDPSWNVFVWWIFYSPTLALFTTHNISWSSDWFIAKYNTSGTILASRRVWWTSDDDLNSIWVDNSWNVYISWNSYSTSFWISMNDSWNSLISWNKVFKFNNLLNNANASVGPSTDKYIAKLDNWLSSISWNKLFASDYYFSSVSIDGWWNVCIWWTFYSAITIWTMSLSLTPSINPDSYILKYDTSWNQVFLKKMESWIVASNIKHIWLNKANAMVAWESVNINSVYADNSWNIYTAWSLSQHAKITVWTEVINWGWWFAVKYDSNLQ